MTWKDKLHVKSRRKMSSLVWLREVHWWWWCWWLWSWSASLCHIIIFASNTLIRYAKKTHRQAYKNDLGLIKTKSSGEAINKKTHEYK